MMLEAISKALQVHVTRLLETRRPGENRQAFAKRIGVGDGTLGRIIAGDGNTRLDTLVAIAAAAKVKPWELLMPASNSVGEPAPTYNLDDGAQLYEAIALAESIIEDAGNPQLSAKARAAVVTAVYKLKLNGVGMESARQIVSDLLANTSRGITDGTGRTNTP